MIPLRDSEVMTLKFGHLNFEKTIAKCKCEGFLKLDAKAKLFHVGE